jgi:hypothetical protein
MSGFIKLKKNFSLTVHFILYFMDYKVYHHINQKKTKEWDMNERLFSPSILNYQEQNQKNTS